MTIDLSMVSRSSRHIKHATYIMEIIILTDGSRSRVSVVCILGIVNQYETILGIFAWNNIDDHSILDPDNLVVI